MIIVTTDRLATLLPGLIVASKSSVRAAFAWLHWTHNLATSFLIRITIKIMMVMLILTPLDQPPDTMRMMKGKEKIIIEDED